MRSGACFSPDRVYRYVLWRAWDASRPPIAVVGLNPSTADETENDPTVRRCIGYAKREGAGGLVMLNLFAFRATDPQVMRGAEDPVGPDNDAFLRCATARTQVVLCAWGAHGAFNGRGRQVEQLLQQFDRPLVCLGRTKEGLPKHPLYIAAAEPFVPFGEVAGV